MNDFDWFAFRGHADFNHSEVTSDTTHVIKVSSKECNW